MENKILERLKNRKTIRAAVMGVFAMLLTVGAVTGQQKLEARPTNTGSPGSVTVSSIKNFGGGNFESDYQGAYFYIRPCTEGFNDLEAYFAGTLYSTVQKNSAGKYITHRDKYLLEGEALDVNDITWSNQFSYLKTQGLTSVPAQTSEALMFVPYATYSGTTLKSGWKANISAICYYDSNGDNVSDRYHVTTSDKYLNNRIFAPAFDQSNFTDYCNNGVFYNTLAKWTADTDKKLSENDLEITRLKKKLGSVNAIKTFVEKNPKLQTEGFNLWCYILSLDGNGSTLNFKASDKVTEFLSKGYNHSYASRNAAYNKSSNPVGVGLGSGLSGKYKLEKWTDTNVNNDLFRKNKFAQREYNLHMLDLMLCAYAASVKQEASAEVQSAWLKAILHYMDNTIAYTLNGSGGSFDSATTTAFPIAICGGTIARGANQTKNGKTTNQVVYVGTQDLVNHPAP